MKRVLVFLLCPIFFVAALSAQDVGIVDSVSLESSEENVDSDAEKIESVVNDLVSKIVSAQYAFLDDGGKQVFKIQTAVIFDKGLLDYSPFKFYGETVSSYYILNKASLAAGYSPAYLYDGEGNPDLWPEENLSPEDFELNADGGFYYKTFLSEDLLSAELYFADPVSIEKYLDAEKKKIQAENLKRDAAIEKIVEQIIDADYSLEVKDGLKLKTSDVLYLANGLSLYEPFKTYRNGRWESCYVLNMASIKAGLAPVYSVEGETNPELWPIERKSSKVLPDVIEENNGFRRNEYQYDWHFTVSYIPSEEEVRIEEEKIERRSKTEAGKAYLDLLGMSLELISGDDINLLVKKTSENKSGVVEVDKSFKIFEISVEKKSMASIYGFKEGDLLIVDTSNKNLSSKIIVDTNIFDLVMLGKNATTEDLYGIFESGKSAKKVTIQIRRKSKKGYEQKEITIKN